MNQGYIKLWRCIEQNNQLSTDNTCWVVFTKLLVLADWRTGEYKTGRKRLAALCNMNPSTVYAALKRLQNMTMVSLRSNNKMTVISICNWSKYQHDDNNDITKTCSSYVTKQEERKRSKNNIYVELDDKDEKKLKEKVSQKSLSSSKELNHAHLWICSLFDKNPKRFKLTKARKQKLKLRLNELGKEDFKKAFTTISKSSFHRGDNDRNWKIDIDPYWLLQSYERAEKWANMAISDVDSDEPIDLKNVKVEFDE